MTFGSCRNLPFGGGAKRPRQMGQSVCLQGRKRAESPPTFIRGKRLKNQKEEGLRILKMRVRELFMHEEGISTPCTCHKGRQPLIECARHDFKTMYFPLFYVFYAFSLFIFYYPFLAFYVFYFFGLFMLFTFLGFLCFLLFWGRQGYFPRSYISSGSMRNSNLRSSLSLKVCVFDWFYVFLKDWF